MKDIRVLAMDPGTSNFAASILRFRFDGTSLKFKCEGTVMLDPQRLLKDMKVMRASLQTFLEYVEPLFAQDFDIFVAERFQARGGKGPTIESVNSMLGAMAIRSSHVQAAEFITAGVWKNEFNRHGDLKEMYLDLAEMHKEDKSVIKIHQLDSMLLGFYAAYKHFGIKPFSDMDSRKKEFKLLSALWHTPRLDYMPDDLPKQKKTKKRRKKV